MKCLFKFDKNIPEGALVVDTTSNSGDFRDLSPFVLSAPPAKRFENLWQFSKVYKTQVDENGNPNHEWYKWRINGWCNDRAIRYPMGKGAKPLYSLWLASNSRVEKRLDYIEARKIIYATEYSKSVIKTKSYAKLKTYYESQRELILLDYDAYDHQALGMTLKDVINNPNKKMGHAFVLMMMLTGVISDCVNS